MKSILLTFLLLIAFSWSYDIKTASNGLRYYDNENEGKVVLFLNGSPSSAESARSLNFLEKYIDRADLRIISPERPGTGQSPDRVIEIDTTGPVPPPQPNLWELLYIQEVIELLRELEITNISVIAYSSGGIFVDELVSLGGNHIESIHLVAAVSDISMANDPYLNAFCSLSNEEYTAGFSMFLTNPEYFVYGMIAQDQQVAFGIPGLADYITQSVHLAYNGDISGSMYEDLSVTCNTQMLYVGDYTGKVFTYHGTLDGTFLGGVSMDHSRVWTASFPNATVTNRVYENEGHLVIFRHLGQILSDVYGKYIDSDGKERILTCENDRMRWIDEDRVTESTLLDVCLWYN
jgi:pimeloyl-ACP methyl ester carboxylesterase